MKKTSIEKIGLLSQINNNLIFSSIGLSKSKKKKFNFFYSTFNINNFENDNEFYKFLEKIKWTKTIYITNSKWKDIERIFSKNFSVPDYETKVAIKKEGNKTIENIVEKTKNLILSEENNLIYAELEQDRDYNYNGKDYKVINENGYRNRYKFYNANVFNLTNVWSPLNYGAVKEFHLQWWETITDQYLTMIKMKKEKEINGNFTFEKTFAKQGLNLYKKIMDRENKNIYKAFSGIGEFKDMEGVSFFKKNNLQANYIYHYDKFNNKKIQNIYRYDINSSFPSQLVQHTVPFGKPVDLKDVDKNGFGKKWDICYLIKFKSFKMKDKWKNRGMVPFIGKKQIFGARDIEYYYEMDESLEDYQVNYWSFEIENIREFYDVEYEIIDKKVYLLTNDFKTHVNDLFEYRKSSKNLKACLNGGIGKLSQTFMLEKRSKMLLNNFEKFNIDPVEEEGKDILSQYNVPNLKLIHYIWARARIQMLNMIKRNPENFISGHTDSAIFKAPITNYTFNDNLGGWKDEGVMKDVIFFGVNNYIGVKDNEVQFFGNYERNKKEIQEYLKNNNYDKVNIVRKRIYKSVDRH